MAIERHVARPLALDVAAAANGIVTVINSRMEGELRLRLIARGFDPRTFALVALGGAGPVRACMIAKSLGIRHVIVPPYPGIGSAMGLLMTDVKRNYLVSRLKPLAQFPGAEMAAIFDSLIARANAEASAEDTDPATLRYERILDLRYLGQGYELSIPCPTGAFTDAAKAAIVAAFHALHAQTYGYDARDRVLEVVNFRLVTTAVLRKLELHPHAGTAAEPAPVKSTRRAYFGGWVDTPIYDRARLAPGQVIPGPAIIEQSDSTTVLVAGQTARPDRFGNLIVSTGTP